MTAVVLLRALPQFKTALIVHATTDDQLADCDACVDVGGIYNPKLNKFDIHQYETLQHVGARRLTRSTTTRARPSR